VYTGEETPRWESLATAAVVLYLVGRLGFLAFMVDPSLPPDEISHVGQARSQIDHWGMPRDSPASYEHGLVSHRPFLNTWLMARWLALQPAPVAAHVWLRLANVAIALGTLAATLAWSRRAGARPGDRVLVALLLTNLPMWSFLSASVNYDNLAMFFATVAFALLARYLDTRSPVSLAGFFLALTAGVLTKSAMLPLAALLTVGLVVSGRGSVLLDARALLRAPFARGPAVAALLAACLLSALLAGALYGGNWARFGVLEPAAHQVLPIEAARQNRIFQQEHVLRSYRAGAIDERQAVMELQEIDHLGDRAGALWMLRRASAMRRGEGPAPVGRLAYSAVWTPLMAERLFGVMGHRELYKSGGWAFAYALLAGLSLTVLALRLRTANQHVRIGTCVAIGYAAILMQLVNYPIYLTTGLEVEAVQGRYLFPVLAPLLASAVLVNAASLPRPLRLPVGLAVAVFFVAGDFPYLMSQAEPAWWGLAS